MFPLDVDGSYADWYGGHELGHSFGRRHPGFCYENSRDDPNYPFPNGQISDDQGTYTGRRCGRLLPGPTGSRASWRDHLGHHQLLPVAAVAERLRVQGHPRAAHLRGRAIPAGGALRGQAGWFGGPVRREQPWPPPPGSPQTGLVDVVASLDLSSMRGRFRYVNPVAVGFQPAKTGQDVTIRLVSSNGRRLRDYSAPYRFNMKAPL